jgi:hypothetical protein
MIQVKIKSPMVLQEEVSVVRRTQAEPAPRDGRDSLDAPRSRKKSLKSREKIVDRPNVEGDDDHDDDLPLASLSSRKQIKDRWSKFSFSRSWYWIHSSTTTFSRSQQVCDSNGNIWSREAF